MKQSYRTILESLNRHRKPVSTGQVASEAGQSEAGIYRALGSLEEQDYIRRTKEGRRSLVQITKAGKNFMKFNPAPGIEDAGVVKSDYGELQRFCAGLGLEQITISTDSAIFKRKDGELVRYEGTTKRFNDVQKAMAFIESRKGKTNIFFTPATTRVKKTQVDDKEKTEKIFIHSQALWIDLDMPQSAAGKLTTEEERNNRLIEILQLIVNAGLLVYAVVDSGSGFHIYFRVQNKIKDAARLDKALKGLAVKFAGVYEKKTHATYATANMRVPGTTNIKPFGAGKSIRTKCNLHDLKPGNICSLKEIEASLGYDWGRLRQDKYWNERNQKNKAVKGIVDMKVDKAVDKEMETPARGRANLDRIIKNGYDPGFQGDMSAADYWLISEGIRRGHRKETIFGWFTNTENAVCIYRRKELYGKRNRCEGYLELTYKNAMGELKKAK